MIFLPLYLSLLSLINSQLLLTIAHPTIKIVVSVQPVVQSRKTHLNYKSFSKIKIYEFSISLARGKSLRTKKEGNFSVFFSQFGIKKELISILLTWISSVSAESGDRFCKSADESVENSTSRIDG